MNRAKRDYAALFASLCCIFAGYIIINYKLLVGTILYRWAANDHANAIINCTSFGVQFIILALSLLLLPPRLITLFLLALSVSAYANVGYAQILNQYLDLGSMTWLLSEVRQALPAAVEFYPSLLIAAAKLALALGLFLLARALVRRTFGKIARLNAVLVSATVVVLTVLLDPLTANLHIPRGGEFNAYSMIARVFATTYPERPAAPVAPARPPMVRKIVWLVDESVAWSGFHKALPPLGPRLPSAYAAIDFGEAHSMGNCSSPSNAALRWGVNVASASQATDLRVTPSIWNYAKAAGYKTTLIDGQVKGAPQNMIWPPERSLIDQFIPAQDGLETDREIGRRVNAILRAPGQDFIYVVLRGAHYQYESSYPPGALPPAIPTMDKYLKAIQFSKQGVFENVFQDLGQTEAAVFYTSDHGQVIRPGVVPHCNDTPYDDEFSVPLFAVIPERLRADMGFNDILPGRRSHSQIFPTTLVLMGYSRDHAESAYDNALNRASKRLVWFGKTIAPRQAGDMIQFHLHK